MKKVILLSSISLFFSFFSLKAQNGNSFFGFLDFPTSSHANALGGTNISIVGTDASMATMNPALLGPEMANQVNLNFTSYVNSIKWGSALYTRAIRERGAWAVGAQYVDYGNFTQTSQDNHIEGTFNAKDMALQGILSYDITSRLRGGVDVKLLYTAYESYTSVALAVNLGINYYNPEKDLSLSLVARNLGGQLKTFEDTRESLPFDLQVGYSQSLAHAPFRFSITAVNLTHWKTNYIDNTNENTLSDSKKKSNFAKDLFRHVIIGVDYLPTEHFYLAAGYNYKKRNDFSDAGGFLPGFSVGTGLQIRMFDIQASLAKHHHSGTSFMVGVNLLLDKF